MEFVKKLEEPFGITMDFLVDETGAVAEVTDQEMLKQIAEINHLGQDDKTDSIRPIIDRLPRGAKVRKAYGV